MLTMTFQHLGIQVLVEEKLINFQNCDSVNIMVRTTMQLYFLTTIIQLVVAAAICYYFMAPNTTRLLLAPQTTEKADSWNTADIK